MSLADGWQHSGPDRSDPCGEATTRDADERREYSPPRVVPIGPAVRLVRGGFYGKDCDGYTGHYTER